MQKGPFQDTMKMLKVKDRQNLKATRERELIAHKGDPIRLSSDFSTETFQARRDWHEIFKMMKSKDLHQSYVMQQSYHLK